MQKFKANIRHTMGVWLGAAAVGAASITTAQPAHAGLFSLSESEEIKAGEQVRQQAYKEYGRPLPASNPMAQRVRRLGALFAGQAERRNIPYTYEVLQNDQVLNAFAAPGGPIFVTTKLVRTAANDAELAFVLGHETGHIERKHIAKSIEKQQTVGLAAGILGSILSKGKSNDWLNVATNVTYTLWQRGYSRDQERDADIYGVHTMSRLGFNPEGAVNMLGKLGGSGGGVQKYLATHPDPGSRQERVRDIIRQENLVAIAQRAGGGRFRADTNYGDDYYAGTPSYTNTGGYYSGGTDMSRTSLGVPLASVNQGGYRVILAPVGAFTTWAGGRITRNNDRIRAERDGNYIVIRVGSDIANLNGRQVRLPVAARSINGRPYAPLGSLATGLGGQATFDQSRNAIRVDFDGGNTGWLDL